MTNEDLQKFIRLANTGKGGGRIFKRSIGGNVDEARIITIRPKPTDEVSWGIVVYDVFLIKAETGEYVGIVFDMSHQDLHWYISKNHRGKGLMKAALFEYILPWLSENGRDEQRVTISRSIPSYAASVAIAKSIGFKEVKSRISGRDEFLLKLDFEADYIEDEVTLTAARVEEIRKELCYYHKRLKMLYAEYEMTLPGNYNLNDFFTETIKNVSYLGLRILDKRLDNLESIEKAKKTKKL